MQLVLVGGRNNIAEYLPADAYPLKFEARCPTVEEASNFVTAVKDATGVECELILGPADGGQEATANLPADPELTVEVEDAGTQLATEPKQPAVVTPVPVVEPETSDEDNGTVGEADVVQQKISVSSAERTQSV